MIDTSYLSKLRAYRGSDEAVSVIANRNTLGDLLLNSKDHTRNAIIDEVMTCYAGTAYADVNWPKIICAWGNRPQRVTASGVFAQQNPQLSQLNLDQGVVTHITEFTQFLLSQDSPNYVNAREQFKQYLGTQTVWRGMVLSDEEAKTVCTQGIESSFLRKTKDMPCVIENFEANVLSVFFSEVVERHFHGENYWSPLVSVSSHKDVAIAVGRHFGGRLLADKSKSLHLFKIQIPCIDLIYYTEHCARLPSKLQDFVRNDFQLHVSVNGVESEYPWDRDTESYVMYKINPDEIVEVTKPELHMTSWNGRICK